MTGDRHAPPRRPVPPRDGSAEVDPITLEVVRNALVGVAEEAGAALTRTAASPNIKERIDCSTAVFDASGRMVAQAEHIPVHLGSMPASVEAALAAFPGDDGTPGGGLVDGDQVLVSDPYAGGNHLPDWTLIAPVHTPEGVLLGYAANRAHQSDVGGSAPGSMPAGPLDIVAEGLRIPPVRIVRAGDTDRDLLALLLHNTRTPDERRGDLRAQIGANVLTGRRLRDLAERRGVDGLAAAMTATLDHAERAVRAALREVPDGTWQAVDHLDDDGAGTRDVALRVTVTVDGDRLVCDFSDSDDQVPGSVNAPRAVTVSAAVYVLRAVIAPDVPSNAGATRPLEVVTRSGSVLDPRAPAPVAAGNVETSSRTVDVLLAALATALPDRVPAASQGTMNNTLLGGRDPRRGPDATFTYYETLGGGTGAGPWGPGAAATQSHMTNTRNTPVEAFELAYPLRVVETSVRRGSGGAGRHRGGDGLRRVLEVLEADVTATLITERRVRGAPGLDGGADGAPGRNAIERDGDVEELPAKVTRQLRRGDRLIVETPGGGGHGPSR